MKNITRKIIEDEWNLDKLQDEWGSPYYIFADSQAFIIPLNYQEDVWQLIDFEDDTVYDGCAYAYTVITDPSVVKALYL